MDSLSDRKEALTASDAAILDPGQVDRSEGRIPRISADEHARRLERLRNLLTEESLDAIVIYGNANYGDFIRYLTNYVHPYPPTQSVAVISRKNAPVLLIDAEWQIESASTMSALSDIRPMQPWNGKESLGRTFGRVLREFGCLSGTIGLSFSTCPVLFREALSDAAPASTFVDADPIWWKLVASPTEFDQETIRKTAHVASEGIIATAKACEPNVTELEAALAGLRRMGELGAEFFHGSGSCTHIQLGSFSKLPANVRPVNYTTRRLTEGMLFWVDLSGTLEGYYADMDRTVGIGSISSEQVHLYEITLRMYEAMLAIMRPGIAGKEVYRSAMRIAEEAGFDKNVNSVPLGHTTGITTGARPLISRDEDMEIVDGSFINIEPGIHTPFGAACLEDTVYVSGDGGEAINTAPLEILGDSWFSANQ